MGLLSICAEGVGFLVSLGVYKKQTNYNMENNKINIPEVAGSKPTCGLVMPMSPTGDCSEAHWQEIKDILSDSIEIAGFEPQMVSDADDAGIIQKRIIQNLYQNPIVVCDVSGKNPNVMFELGMRLAFDKPTIIVKDDKTDYSFDTAPIEHLGYPRDLRFANIVTFKEALSRKIKATYDKSKSDKNYTTFLKNFGTFNVPKLDTQEVSKDDFVLEELRQIRTMMGSFSRRGIFGDAPSINIGNRMILCVHNCSQEKADEMVVAISQLENVDNLALQKVAGTGHFHISLAHVSREARIKILSMARSIVPAARLM